MSDKDNNAQHFLDLIRQSRRGKFKIYIGMSAGVGKTYRMLQEARTLLRNGVDIKIAYIETHNRAETHALLDGLPIIPRRELFYKGKALEELDMQAVLNLHPEVVVIDELAHTNIEGSKNEKRWQDVMEILEAGINVISAVNIQHIEGLQDEVKNITGVDVAERIPDLVLQQADEVVNIDLTADELVTRLKEGKIYTPDKIAVAMKNFFQPERILQLRELALKEVATQVERKIESSLPRTAHPRNERFLACVSSNHVIAKKVIRKTARLAAYYQSKWYVLYVQTPKEDGDKIGLAEQRHLINNFKLAMELGGEVIKVKNSNIAKSIMQTADEKKVTTICLGKPHLNVMGMLLNTAVFSQLLGKLSESDIDIIILS
ncbi:sensor protein KdpD [Chitinophaga pinensis]|uniref:Osmosensitive K channel signal transduction histidine kinase, sensor subunit KdpD n=1 Tax=Chitinophaga pinensis (strain ATCC 43595 / DSM 2588 / LMG 13176 / NBRC 15968 / NCIMB 11800 / UQM 2034) TaxID=485918 RepID=A0A979G581_CHIPD|nr:sensor protein KdpD [Chitinophaga pinensis]ACU61074.1 osmosensitive K channel signal transduction histidine kinase, sensor subunit KdpD [Chitinophaga pinensis DSM 2588]